MFARFYTESSTRVLYRFSTKTNTGEVLPVEATIKTDMGGLRADDDAVYQGFIREMDADGPGLSNTAFAASATLLRFV